LPDATSEEDIWEVFNRLSDTFNEDDEVIFDITHSFRSLPMIFTILLQYLKVTKRVRVRGVYYGAIEKLGPVYKVKAMPMEERNVPIVDLTSFFNLYDWTAAIQNFLRFGSATELKTLAEQVYKPILRDTRGQDETARLIRGTVNELDRFATATHFARGQELAELRIASNIVQPLRQITEEKNDLLPPLKPVFKRLEAHFSAYPDADLLNGLRAVSWCIEHEQWQQGITLLQEAIISNYAACLPDSVHKTGDDGVKISGAKAQRIYRRDFVSKLFNVASNPKITEEQWGDELKRHKSEADELLEGVSPIIIDNFGRLSQIRNSINHGGYGDNLNSTVIRDRFVEIHQAVVEALLA
jgi:CRISPR-associated DxTHG motif protein